MYKWKNPHSVQGPPESNGYPKDVSGSTYSHGHFSVLASANVKSMSPVSIPKLNSTLQASSHDEQAIEESGYSAPKKLLDGQAHAVASDPGQPTVAKAQTESAVAEGPASFQAPTPTTAIA